MSLRNRQVPSCVAVKSVLAIFAVLSLSFLVACGSSSPHGTPPPTGGFSNSNLSGTYAFSVVGEDINGGIIAFAGTFTANGSGGITGGTIDVVEPAGPLGSLQGVGVTGGGYNVGADGRPESKSGLLTLVTANGSFAFDFVLSSSNGGLITYYSTNENYGGSGSGSFQLQTSVSQSSINGQSYTFSTSGASSTASVATAGAFTLNGSGSVATGIEDLTSVSNTGVVDVPCGASGCTMTAGNITLSSTAGAPGTASFTTTPGTFTFDVYPVSPSQLIFIETDGTFFTTGNAFSQATSIPAGNNVYSVAGIDISDDEPTASVGLLVTNGSGGITSGYQDYNDAGTSPVSPDTFTGSYTTLTSGRSVITLVGFVNESGLGCSSCSFAVYPFVSGGVSGMEILEIDGGGITGGVAYAQTASPTFASGQGYGMNLTGSNLSLAEEVEEPVEEDDIAEFTNSSGTLTGLIDFNDAYQGQVTTAFAQKYTATYAADSTGISGRGTVTTPTPGTTGYGMATYVVDSSTSLAVVNDGSGMVALGMLDTQSATTAASANAAQQHLVAIRAAMMAGKHLKKGKNH